MIKHVDAFRQASGAEVQCTTEIILSRFDPRWSPGRPFRRFLLLEMGQEGRIWTDGRAALVLTPPGVGLDLRLVLRALRRLLSSGLAWWPAVVVALAIVSWLSHIALIAVLIGVCVVIAFWLALLVPDLPALGLVRHAPEEAWTVTDVAKPADAPRRSASSLLAGLAAKADAEGLVLALTVRHRPVEARYAEYGFEPVRRLGRTTLMVRQPRPDGGATWPS